MAQNLPRRSPWSSAMAVGRLPCQGSTHAAHTGPDPRLSLGLGEIDSRVEVAGSSLALTFTPIS